MKYPFLFLSLLWMNVFAQTENVILVTLDGYRWQEVFNGADKKLISRKKVVKDSEALKNTFWDNDVAIRREKLTPFIWKTIASKGVLIGNRLKGSKMKVTNPMRFSYPGYSEMFSGYGNPKVNSNDFPDNPNLTIFDLLSNDEQFKGKIVAAATWDAFPRIINTNRNGVPVYINFKDNNGIVSNTNTIFERWHTSIPPSNAFITDDSLTYHFAKEYIVKNRPRFAFIGFDQTDHFGHEGQYDAYLHSANQLDSYIEDLWNFIQTDPHYKDKTTLIVTCDHGRGHAAANMWRHHGQIILSSDKIWMAAIGPGIKPLGVLKKGKFYQKQIGPTIAALFGKTFYTGKKIGKPVKEILK